MKLFDEVFFCFPLTGNNSVTLTFLFDCLDMKLNIPTCFKRLYLQGSTIIIKLTYVITYVCQNFGVHDIYVQIPKSIYQASYLLPGDFPNNI